MTLYLVVVATTINATKDEAAKNFAEFVKKVAVMANSDAPSWAESIVLVMEK